jgi:penicillin-binding protein 1A
MSTSGQFIPPAEVQFDVPAGKARRKSYRLLRWVIIGVPVLVLLGISAFVASVLNDLPPLTAIENPEQNLSSLVYTADGQLLRSFFDEEHRISVEQHEISPFVFGALIATEDARFYQHNGIDPEALFAMVKDRISGKGLRGASTITMQLARNLYNEQVGRTRSANRKIKEMIVAVILERKFTKDEIITAYLNTVSFVGNTYGIQNAAQVYFKKDAKDLGPEEAALLVGLLKAPDEYNPKRHPEKSLTRRNLVLQLMVAHKDITQAECDSLKAIPIDLEDYRMEDHNTTIAPYFTEHLRQWLKAWCEERGLNMYKDGLRIHTTIDSRMQRYAETSVDEHLTKFQKVFRDHIDGHEPWLKDTNFLPEVQHRSHRYIAGKRAGKSDDEIEREWNTPIKMQIFGWDTIRDTVLSPWDSLKYYCKFLETGFMAIDPTNGHIKAWVGGIDHRFFQYDHVYLGKRQVGSTFKPFVYAAAFENGNTPCDKELNQPVTFKMGPGQKDWVPKNADGKVGGYMTMREGLASSQNLITARVLKRISPETVCEWAHNCGIRTKLDCVPALILGTTELSVYELVGAYATFVNHGIWNEPIFVTRIEDRHGTVIQEFTGDHKEALSEFTAYMMLNMLMGVVRERGGTGGRLISQYKLYNEIGGKTGTTQKQSDGWFVGVTPNLCAGAWVGCSERTMRFRSITNGQGAAMALPIYGLFMQKVYADSTIMLPKDPFERPRGFDVELDCRKYRSPTISVDDSDSLNMIFNSVMDPDKDDN